MSVEVRACPPDRFAELVRTAEVAFVEDAPDDLIARVERVADPERFLGAIDGDRFVGTAGVFALQLAVPGGEVAAGGITWVTVLPSHRRRGLMSSMMRLMIDDCHRRGEPVAILWAAEAAIYQRFGFGMATSVVNVHAETRAFRFARDWPREGATRLLRPGEGLDLVTQVYEAARLQRPGFLARTPDWWAGILPLVDKDAKGGEARRLVVYEVGGNPEAYAVYKGKSNWDALGPNAQTIVEEAVASTDRGTREIWRYLMELDLARTLRAVSLPVDHPLLTLAAEPRRLGLTVSDGLWMRVVDVAAALEARTYGADGHANGRLAFELDDAYCPWNSGRWELDVSGGQGRVSRTAGEPDLVLSPNDLAAMYLGLFSASALAAAGRVVETRAGGLAAADTLFATALRPWCPQEF